jgi:hypothetical protein
MMTITTISPKNHFKKILASTKDIILDKTNCDWLGAYYTVKKYKLFSLKPAISIKLYPEYLSMKSEEEVLRLTQTIFKVKALINQ